MKLFKLASALVLSASALAGCYQDPTGVTTVPVGGTATLSWQAPSTTTDGQALMDLAGYRIYYGTSTTDLSQTIQLEGVGIQTYVVDNLGSGTWYFAIRAVTSNGVESALSEIVSKTIG